MIEVGGRIILAAVLVAASVVKLASPRSSSAALATFGIDGPRARWIAWAGLIVTELALAAGVAAGLDLAAYLAAAMMAVFGVVLEIALRRGRAGAPCACFGARSTVSRAAVLRNFVLSCAFVALPLLPTGDLTTDEWLALGLGVALLACAGLAVAVLALAREVGMLRLRLGPGAALEIPEEGPPIGLRTGMIGRFAPSRDTRLALAVFVSDSCHVCRGLEPAIASLGRDPTLAVEVFEEGADPGTWTALDVPGSPYAVALDPGGVVLAKGTFNNLAQLESVLVTAERRRDERAAVEGVGV
jgi:Methylamine utilisation protein MauE